MKNKKECSFCRETDCPANGKFYFPNVGTVFVDFRADMEANQIDCEVGILNEDGYATQAQWSNFAIDINYCPVCGRKLPECY